MLFINIHKAYDLVSREEMYIILFQSSSHIKTSQAKQDVLNWNLQ